MKKEAFYFSHDSNALSDEKVQCLLADHGMEGYGIYWALVERMFDNSDTSLSHQLLRGLAFSLRIDITLLSSVITTCIAVKLFVSDGESFYSESLRRRKQIWENLRQKKSDAGKLGMAKRWAQSSNNQARSNKGDNTVITEPNIVITPDNKGKKSKRKERVYTHPSVEEVENYFSENGYSKDAGHRAWKYYDAANWIDSEGKPVRSWKQKMQGVWFKPENLSTVENPKTRKIEMVL